MLNMLFSLFAYIFWAQLLATYYILLTNCIPNLVFMYLFGLYHCYCSINCTILHVLYCVAFMFWVHLLTFTCILGIYIFYKLPNLAFSYHFIIAIITNITVFIRQTENTVRI